MAEKTQKEKPRYGVWQNVGYVIKGAWAMDKGTLFAMAIEVVVAVGLSLAALYLPKAVVGQIMRGAEAKSMIATILTFTAGTVLLQAVKAYLGLTSEMQRTGLRMQVCRDIQQKVVTTSYENLEKKAFSDARQKALEQIGGNNTSTEQIYYTLVNLGTNVCGFVLYLLLLVWVNPWVLLLTAATSAIGFFMRRRVNRWEHEQDKQSASWDKRLWQIHQQSQQTVIAKDIRLFAMADWLMDVHRTNARLRHNLSRKVQAKQWLADAVDCVVAFLREGAAYAYLIVMVLAGALAVDEFVLLFAAISGFSGWITGILSEYEALDKHSLNYCRVRKCLEFEEPFEEESGEPVYPQSGAVYELELENVSFCYEGAAENTLENISLIIRPGEKLAIVGLNGAGKTTLINLLCGFYNPTKGRVLLNGKDIRAFNRRQYYGLFTAVFQDFSILPVTLAQTVSQQYEAYDEDRIKRCLALADLDEKVESLPAGLASLLVKSVHEDAVEFSGGETQRLMLARALYQDAPILILDEPTAALDPIAESRLYERYSELSAGKTAVYISHRLASTRFCDRIILLADKGIAECGTHDALIAQGGAYARLFEIQSRYYQQQKEEASA